MSRYIKVLSSLAIVLGLGVRFGGHGAEAKELTEIESFVSTDWLMENLQADNLKVIDATIFFADPEGEFIASGMDQYKEHHIPGAIFADLIQANEVEAEIPFTYPGSSQFIDYMKSLGINNEDFLVVYDSGPQVGVDFEASSWASRLAWQLELEGKKNVAVLEGGLEKWLAEDLPTETEVPEVSPGEITGSTQSGKIVSMEEVEAALEDDGVVIVDVLDAAQFAGESHPFGEDRAGHIPGAENIFYGDLADPETGELLPEAELREIFTKLGALDQDKEVIVYCGFGVAATYVSRIIESLGQEQVAVYDGSLQEWAGNPDLPLETAVE